MKRYFFGWKNIRRLLREIAMAYSGKPSLFSKKRIESGISFFIAQAGMIAFLILHIQDLTAYDISLWAGLEFAVAGYMVRQIQKEKHNFSDYRENLENVSENNMSENNKM